MVKMTNQFKICMHGTPHYECPLCKEKMKKSKSYLRIERLLNDNRYKK